MAVISLDQKIQDAIDRISFLISRNSKLVTDMPLSEYAYGVSQINNDPAGAQLNKNAFVAMGRELATNVAELKTLNTPVTGVLAVLQSQKQIQLQAQTAVVTSTLTAQQKAAIELAKIKAEEETAKIPVTSNTKTYVIISVVAVVVIVISVLIYLKFKIKKA